MSGQGLYGEQLPPAELTTAERMARIEEWLDLPLVPRWGLKASRLIQVPGAQPRPVTYRDVVEAPPVYAYEDSLALPSYVYKVDDPSILVPLYEAHLAALGVPAARELFATTPEAWAEGIGLFTDVAREGFQYFVDPIRVGFDMRLQFEGREWYRMYAASPQDAFECGLIIAKPLMMDYASGGSAFPLVYMVGEMEPTEAEAVTSAIAAQIMPEALGQGVHYPDYERNRFGGRPLQLADYLDRPYLASQQ